MDSQDVLMKRLAAASHNKIYPSILPKSELQLRRILLTTRLWNDVRRQQALMLTSLQDDWWFTQEDVDQLSSPGDTSTANLEDDLDPLDLSILSSSSLSSGDKEDDGITSKNQHQHQDELDDDDDDDELGDDDDTNCTWLYDDVDDGIVKESNMEQDVKKPYDWTWLDDGTKETDHETIPLVTSPFTTLTTTTPSLNDNNNDNHNGDFYDSLGKSPSNNITNKSRKRQQSSPEVSTKSETTASSASLESPRKRNKSSSSVSTSSSTFAICTSSASSTIPAMTSVPTDPPAGPRSPPTPSSPVLLSV